MEYSRTIVVRIILNCNLGTKTSSAATTPKIKYTKTNSSKAILTYIQRYSTAAIALETD